MTVSEWTIGEKFNERKGKNLKRVTRRDTGSLHLARVFGRPPRRAWRLGRVSVWLASYATWSDDGSVKWMRRYEVGKHGPTHPLPFTTRTTW